MAQVSIQFSVSVWWWWIKF